MRNLILFCGLVLFSISASAAGPAATPWNRLHGKLEKELPAEKSGVYSPLSLWIALAMLEAGAEKQTDQELRKLLSMEKMTSQNISEQFKSISASKFYEIKIVNGLWPNAALPYKKEYIELIKRDFGADFTPVNFAKNPDGARTQINSWIEKATDRKISQILGRTAITPDTKFVLANAIYFKGTWDLPFEKSQTRDGSFQIGAGRSSKVKMMRRKDYFGYFEDTKVQALRMDYEGDGVYFLAILPKPGKSLGEAAPFKLEEIRDRVSGRSVDVNFPRFTIQSDIAALPAKLKRLGLSRVFTPQAELGKIAAPGKYPLFVTDVIHKAMIEVNEAGTEVAAANVLTGEVGGGPAANEKSVSFTADRPFRFYIVHRATKSVLFSGEYFGD